MKRVAVLGSTGSIGTQTLDIIEQNRDKLKVHSLVAYSNEKLLSRQVDCFAPHYSALISQKGKNCLIEAVEGADVAVVATSGITALECVLFCFDNGIDVAIANKETLVCAGELVMSKMGKAKLFPIDSEHCAIRECLLGHNGRVNKILLTASGGPFWDIPSDSLANVTAEQALKHPNWNMGQKITVDSATMMNKSLEVVEAKFLFGIPAEQIQIVVHRQSVVHSMVEFANGEVVAQLATADMRLPIQLALLGEEGNFSCKSVDFARLLTLTFEQCDFDKFPCARLGYEIWNYPPLCRTVMNGANDVCVESFLRGKLSFDAFYNIILTAVKHFENEARRAELNVDNICLFDRRAKEYTRKLINGELC